MLVKNNKKKLICIAVGVVALVGIVTYVIIRSQAKSKFVSGTVINEIDVSGMNLEELKARIQDYSIDVIERTSDGGSITETIKGSDFDVNIGENEKAAQDILDNQSVWQYLKKEGKEYTIDNWLEYNEDKLMDAIGGLKCFDRSFYKAPEDAEISDYSKTEGYQIIEEKQGNTVNKEKANEAVLNAVHGMEKQLDLDKEDCYEKPSLTADSQELTQILEELNKYTGVTITYKFDENEEILDGNTISQWIKVNKKNKVVFDEEKVSEFVASLRKKYDTIFSARKFKTSYGNTVTVNGGDYGWWMNYQKEEKELLKLIKKGKSTERTPEYYQTAESYGKHDYGNSYIEINLTTQHIFLYIDGKKILESDCVTGNSARGYDTPEGTYGITYTQRDATLNGENYSTPVKYWMPFNRNIGLHDASWRSRFGGTEYKYNGSHGCVNLPPAIAAKLFKYAKTGMPVICYKSEATKVQAAKEKKKQKKSSASKKVN